MADAGFVTSPGTNSPSLDLGYKVSYSTEHGTAPSSAYVSALTASELPTLSCEDYTFWGWFYDSKFMVAARVGDGITKATTLYAKFGIGGYATPEITNGTSFVKELSRKHGNLIISGKG